MQINDILLEKGSDVKTIDADLNIHDAISVLTEHSIGALVVTGEAEAVVGIITERDILRKCGECCNHGTEPSGSRGTVCASSVRDAMTTDLIIGVPEDGPNYAMGIMTKNHIRHLPIMDNGNLVGLISIGDLVNMHLEEKIFKRRTLKDYLSRNSAPEDV